MPLVKSLTLFIRQADWSITLIFQHIMGMSSNIPADCWAVEMTRILGTRWRDAAPAYHPRFDESAGAYPHY